MKMIVYGIETQLNYLSANITIDKPNKRVVVDYPNREDCAEALQELEKTPEWKGVHKVSKVSEDGKTYQVEYSGMGRKMSEVFKDIEDVMEKVGNTEERWAAIDESLGLKN